MYTLHKHYQVLSVLYTLYIYLYCSIVQLYLALQYLENIMKERLTIKFIAENEHEHSLPKCNGSIQGVNGLPLLWSVQLNSSLFLLFAPGHVN